VRLRPGLRRPNRRRGPLRGLRRPGRLRRPEPGLLSRGQQRQVSARRPATAGGRPGSAASGERTSRPATAGGRLGSAASGERRSCAAAGATMAAVAASAIAMPRVRWCVMVDSLSPEITGCDLVPTTIPGGGKAVGGLVVKRRLRRPARLVDASLDTGLGWGMESHGDTVSSSLRLAVLGPLEVRGPQVHAWVTEGLTRWRGPPLADVELERTLLQEVARIEALRVSAQELAVEAARIAIRSSPTPRDCSWLRAISSGLGRWSSRLDQAPSTSSSPRC